jgi:CheY-like chemotaxis protein
MVNAGVPRALIAEDDPAIRGLLAITLRRRRIDTVLAANGKEAIEGLQHGPWDALVLDLMMPVIMDGKSFGGSAVMKSIDRSRSSS